MCIYILLCVCVLLFVFEYMCIHMYIFIYICAYIYVYAVFVGMTKGHSGIFLWTPGGPRATV